METKKLAMHGTSPKRSHKKIDAPTTASKKGDCPIHDLTYLKNLSQSEIEGVYYLQIIQNSKPADLKLGIIFAKTRRLFQKSDYE